MTTLHLPGALVALTPGDLEARKLEAFAHEAVRAAASGLEAILVREPALSDLATLELVLLLRRVLPTSTWIGLHDRVHLAAAAGADAVHVGFRSLRAEEARKLVPPSMAVGFSAHAGDPDDARRGADYLFFGPVLETPSKRGLKDPVGFEGLRAACAASSTPIWALGGIEPDHAVRALECGARGIAVRSGIFGTRDPDNAVRAYLGALRTDPRAALWTSKT